MNAYFLKGCFFIVGLLFMAQMRGEVAVRINCLGNSLTAAENPGYRGILCRQLAEAGYTFDFVGVATTYSDTAKMELQHSGFGGYDIGPGKSLIGNIYENLYQGHHFFSVEADVMILEIGINDFFNSRDSLYFPDQQGAYRLDSLIAAIYKRYPDIQLVVSNVSPIVDWPDFACNWNEEVARLVVKYKGKGYACYLADLRKGIDWKPGDISEDKVHPLIGGYRKMARLYFEILAQILPKPEIVCF